MRAALLPRIEQRHAAEILEDPNAVDVLTRFEIEGLFTLRRGGAFEFHPLLREYLESRGVHSLTESERRETQRRGAWRFAEDGEIEDAIALFFAAKDWEGAGHWIWRVARSLIATGRTSTLLSWLRELPEAFVGRSGWLSYWLGRSGTLLGFDVARSALENALACFERESELSGQALALAALLDLAFYEWRSLRPLDAWLDRATELLDAPIPADARATLEISAARALNYRDPRLMPFPRVARVLREWSAPAVEESLRLQAVFSLGAQFLFAGRPRELERILAIARAALHHDDDIQQLALAVLASGASWHLGHNERCLEICAEALDRSARTGVHLLDHQIRVNQAYAAIMQRDRSQAQAALQALEAETAPKGSPLHDSHVAMLRGWEAGSREDWEAAREAAEMAIRGAREAGMPFAEAMCSLLAAQIDLATDRPDAASPRIDAAMALGKESRCGLLEFASGLVAAEWWSARGHPRRAAQALRESLERGEAQGTPCFPGQLPWLAARSAAGARGLRIGGRFVDQVGRFASGPAPK